MFGFIISYYSNYIKKIAILHDQNNLMTVSTLVICNTTFSRISCEHQLPVGVCGVDYSICLLDIGQDIGDRKSVV